MSQSKYRPACKCGLKMDRDIAREQGGFRHAPGNWPMKSDALGVHPDDIKEASEYAASKGIPTEFNSDGQAILTSPKHRRQYAELYGFYDKNAGYSDPQKGRFNKYNQDE